MSIEENEDLSGWLHSGVRQIHRDEVLWVLDKPAGVLSHPNSSREGASKTLLRGAYDFRRELYRLDVPGSKQRQVYLVHRLDQETSGLILCALDAKVAAALKEAFVRQEVKKEYQALLLGSPTPPRGEWRDRLEKVSGRSRATVTVVRGRPNAMTCYATREAFQRQGVSLVSLRPETGRTHQLRVQSAFRHQPIAGDERYGDFSANRFLATEIGLKRMFLHACRFELRHPSGGHMLKLEAPLPRRLEVSIDKLRELRQSVPRR